MGRAHIRFRGGPWDGYESKDFREAQLPDFFYVQLEPTFWKEGELAWATLPELLHLEPCKGCYPFPYGRKTRFGYYWGNW